MECTICKIRHPRILGRVSTFISYLGLHHCPSLFPPRGTKNPSYYLVFPSSDISRDMRYCKAPGPPRQGLTRLEALPLVAHSYHITVASHVATAAFGLLSAEIAPAGPAVRNLVASSSRKQNASANDGSARQPPPPVCTSRWGSCSPSSSLRRSFGRFRPQRVRPNAQFPLQWWAGNFPWWLLEESARSKTRPAFVR